MSKPAARHELKSNESSRPETLHETIPEQDEWLRNEMSKVIGEESADHIMSTKPDVLEASMKSSPNKQRNTTNTSKLRKKHLAGLYAHNIWDGLRDDSKARLKPFDLNKELQASMDSFIRNELYHNKHKTVEKSVRSDDEMVRNKTILDMRRITKAKALRNETELMYRSSKLNEEKFGVLRANSPLPDLNDKDGREGIRRYLPPIYQLDNHKKLNKIDTNTELITSPLLRDLYQHKLEMRLAEERNKIKYTLIENQVMNKQTNGYQPVKLVYMTEKNASNPEWRESALDVIQDKDKALIADDAVSVQSAQIKEEFEEKKDELSRDEFYPPLTLNALMEYRKAVKAPGAGDFNQGKPKMYKLLTESSVN